MDREMEYDDLREKILVQHFRNKVLPKFDHFRVLFWRRISCCCYVCARESFSPSSIFFSGTKIFLPRGQRFDVDWWLIEVHNSGSEMSNRKNKFEKGESWWLLLNQPRRKVKMMNFIWTPKGQKHFLEWISIFKLTRKFMEIPKIFRMDEKSWLI